MRTQSGSWMVLIGLAALATPFVHGGCSTTSGGGDRSTNTKTTQPTPAFSSTRTRTFTSTPAPVTSTPTPVPCNGNVPCNPTAVSAATMVIPWSGGATISVGWANSGCNEIQWYGGALDGFQYSTGTVVTANATTDDGHFHLSASTYGGIGYWHTPNASTGVIAMGAVPLSDPSMANPPDPASNTYSGCCVQIHVGQSYFVRCASASGWARVHIVCVDITSGTTVDGIRFQWDWAP